MVGGCSNRNRPTILEVCLATFCGAYADHQSARTARPPGRGEEGKGARTARQSAEARGVHAGVHDDAEEAELGVAESCARSADEWVRGDGVHPDRKSTRLNSSHSQISYAVFCLKKKKT